MRMVAGEPPRFILGEDADFAEWIVHLREPMFAAKIRTVAEFTQDEIERPDEQFLYFFGDLYDEAAFVNFVWFGREPEGSELSALMESAADFVEQMSE